MKRFPDQSGVRFICGLVLMGLIAAVHGAGNLRSKLGHLPRVMTSATGQFVVLGFEPGSPNGPPPLSSIRTNHVQLDPGVLVLTCERVKSEFLLLLNIGDKWKGAVSIHVDGRAQADTDLEVSATRMRDGWGFRLRLPGQIERMRLVRALVRVLLLEIANRENTSGRLAEVPLWMQEGLAAQLYAMHGDALAASIGLQVFGLDEELAVPKVMLGRNIPQSYERNYTELLSMARRHFELFEPAEFATLQMPLPKDREGFAWVTFQYSAHLFVAELLRLPDGREGMMRALTELKGFLNPQLAFLKAFEARFPNALAADKWWSLICVDFKSREVNLRWSEADTMQRLKEILYTPVSVRTDIDSVPEERVMMMQDLIRETAFKDHRPILARALRALLFVEGNSRRDLARLIRDYRTVIEEYLKGNETGGRSTGSFKVVKDAAIERLDLLDGIRFDFKLVASPEPDREVDLDRIERLLSAPVGPLTPP
ncbi:MAG: hypothetical protein ISQ14_15135 [Verrucomicrobiae bacterium]|nr:hypothetical protein [Verrucomicrobiae bacterium]